MAVAGAELAEHDGFSERVGYRFADTGLLTEALSHRSWCNERNAERPDDERVVSNERLEFLGDAVLGLCMCELAMARWPDLGPGDLSAVRAAVVNAGALAQAARSCGLGRVLMLGKGESATGGADKESILADALEAVLGAIFLDGGLGAAREAADRLLGARLATAAGEPGAREAKNRLQELVFRQFGTEPAYDVSTSGPAHRPRFVAAARVATTVWGRGEGATKRSAERRAAQAAVLRLLHDGADATAADESVSPEERVHG